MNNAMIFILFQNKDDNDNNGDGNDGEEDCFEI